MSLIGRNIDTSTALESRFWRHNLIVLINKLMICIFITLYPISVGSLRMRMLYIFMKIIFLCFLLLIEIYNISAIWKTLLMAPCLAKCWTILLLVIKDIIWVISFITILSVFRLDHLVDNILFNKHHNTSGCLSLHTEKSIRYLRQHDWRLFDSSITGSDQVFLQIQIRRHSKKNNPFLIT